MDHQGAADEGYWCRAVYTVKMIRVSGLTILWEETSEQMGSRRLITAWGQLKRGRTESVGARVNRTTIPTTSSEGRDFSQKTGHGAGKIVYQYWALNLPLKSPLAPTATSNGATHSRKLSTPLSEQHSWEPRCMRIYRNRMRTSWAAPVEPIKINTLVVSWRQVGSKMNWGSIVV